MSWWRMIRWSSFPALSDHVAVSPAFVNATVVARRLARSAPSVTPSTSSGPIRSPSTTTEKIAASAADVSLRTIVSVDAVPSIVAISESISTSMGGARVGSDRLILALVRTWKPSWETVRIWALQLACKPLSVIDGSPLRSDASETPSSASLTSIGPRDCPSIVMLNVVAAAASTFVMSISTWECLPWWMTADV